MKAILCVLVALSAIVAIDAGPLAVVDSGLVNTIKDSCQLLVHDATNDGVADIIGKIKRANEENINSWYCGDLVDLEKRQMGLDELRVERARCPVPPWSRSEQW